MEQLLVLGASGFVGRELLRAHRSGPMTGTFCNSPIDGGIYFDPTKMKLSEIISSGHSFSHAIILFADSDPNSCIAHLEQSRALNIDATQRLLKELRQLEIVPVFTSTEFVFDGTKGRYTEDDMATPILEYGRQKLHIERFIADHFETYITVRLAKVYGGSLQDGTLFTSWMKYFLEGCPSIECANDQFFSPIYVRDVCNALLALTRSGASGLFHLGGPGRYSRIELLHCLVNELHRQGRKPIEIVPRSIDSFGLPERRPRDVSLVSAKLERAVAISPISPETFCARLVQHLLKLENVGEMELVSNRVVI